MMTKHMTSDTQDKVKYMSRDQNDMIYVLELSTELYINKEVGYT